MNLSDHGVVLHLGKKLAEGTPERVRRNSATGGQPETAVNR